MSRIGKKPVAIPSGVTVTLDGQAVTVKGPKGQLAQNIQAQPGPIQTQPGPAPGVDRAPRQPKVRAPQFHAASHGDHASKP